MLATAGAIELRDGGGGGAEEAGVEETTTVERELTGIELDGVLLNS